MKVFVVSVTSQIGTALLKFHKSLGDEVFGSCNSTVIDKFEKIDVTNRKDLEKIFYYSPDIVYICSAATNVDECERNPAKYFDLNVTAPKMIAEMCRSFKATPVFFSSDYVFDGIEGFYDETSVPNPINQYGQQKLIAEFEILKINSDSIIIRTNSVFGNDVKRSNFVLRLQENLQQGKAATIPYDELCAPTFTDDIAVVAAGLLKEGFRGTAHAAGADFTSRYRWALEIADVFGFDRSLICPVTSNSLDRPARRPYNGGLRTILQTRTPACRPYFESLRHFSQNMDLLPSSLLRI